MNHPFDDVIERLCAIAADPAQSACLRYKAAIVTLDLATMIEADAECAKGDAVAATAE